jgi:hypothetical protein
MSFYQEVVVETFKPTGESSAESIRVRPLPGQGLSPDMRVECSSHMRRHHPVGTKLLIRAKVTNRQGGTPFLYSHHNWKYTVLSDSLALSFIKSRFASKLIS